MPAPAGMTISFLLEICDRDAGIPLTVLAKVEGFHVGDALQVLVHRLAQCPCPHAQAKFII